MLTHSKPGGGDGRWASRQSSVTLQNLCHLLRRPLICAQLVLTLSPSLFLELEVNIVAKNPRLLHGSELPIKMQPCKDSLVCCLLNS